MSPAQAVAALDRALDLQRRAANNRAKFYRAGVVGKSASEALARADRQSEAADAEFAKVRAHLLARTP